MKETTFPYYVVSVPSGPNINTIKNGSICQNVLNSPFFFDLEKNDVFCRLVDASIWWNIPNIDQYNNKLHIVYGVTDYIMYFEKGLYSLKDINNKISQFLRENNIVQNGIVLYGDNINGKISILLNQISLSIDMSQSTIKNLLGFDNVLNIGPGVSGTYYQAPFVAKMNSLTNILIHCNFINGVFLNDSSSAILAKVIPDVSPGAQIIYRPYNSLWCRVNNNKIDRPQFSLTDQINRPIDTNGESFTLTLEFLIKEKK
jgi:hypothetical protein